MPIHVRDNRGGNWWWAHNALFDSVGVELGAYPLLVYFCLCRHAGRDQSTWVGQKVLQQQTGTSESTVRRALKTLQDAELIAIHEQVDERGRMTNIYELLAVPFVDAPPVPQNGGGVRENGGPVPIDRSLQFMKKTHGTRRSTLRKKEEGGHEDEVAVNGAVHTNGHAGDAPLDLWQTVLADLREQMVPANFTRWLARTSLLRHEAGAAVVGVPDQVSADQLARRFDPLVRRALADACGETVTVQYQVVANLAV
ncbi:MAG: DnaA N-terminal domain-containing protein [Dehalococcoidia bacterium]